MRPSRIIPMVLALVLAGCAQNDPVNPGDGIIAPPPPPVQLVGVLEVEGDSSIALLYDGDLVALLGLNPGYYARHDGHEVLVEGRWEGDAFRAFSLTLPETNGTPIDTTAQPQLRLPLR